MPPTTSCGRSPAYPAPGRAAPEAGLIARFPGVRLDEDAGGRSWLHVGIGPDLHEHAWAGQVLRHSHPGGGQPHGYYGHPEDPPESGPSLTGLGLARVKVDDALTGAGDLGAAAAALATAVAGYCAARLPFNYRKVDPPAEFAEDGPAAAVTPAAIQELYDDFREADEDGASSNDITQMLDDWFTGHGFGTVLYRDRGRK